MYLLKISALIVSMVLSLSLTRAAMAQSLDEPGDHERLLVKAPPGFQQSCARYSWLCENQEAAASPVDPGEVLDLARRINRRVNVSVSQLSDPENYGVAELWSLPTNGNGDCEDFVLQKYKLLLDAGIDGRDLSIAVVLNRRGENHAVLVLHHSTGDLVLDSLTSRVVPWNETRYRFLAMQSGENKAEWELVAFRNKSGNALALR